MKKLIVVFICLIILTGCGTVKRHNTEGNSKASIVKISCAQKDELIKEGAILIDVREVSEYNESHLEGSVNVPLGKIELISNYIASLTKETKIIVYCKSGKRSNEAAQKLLNMGYNYIYNLGAITNCKK